MRTESRARRAVRSVLSMLLGAVALVLLPSPAYAAGTISGTLKDTLGNDVDGQVDLYLADGTLIDSVFAAGGPYSFPSLPNGTYKVGVGDNDGLYVPTYYNNKTTLGAADPIAVNNANRPGINLTVAYAVGNTGQISGTVGADGGGPLAGIAVTAYQLEGLDWLPKGSDLTDGTGGYALDLLPGTYRVGFTDPGETYAAEFHAGAATVEDADDVVVEAGETDDVDASLTPTGQVSGTVVGQADPDPALDPLGGIVATLYHLDGGDWVEVASDATDGTGAYSLRVPAGTYRLGFADPVDTFADEFYDDVPTVAVATDVVVASGGSLTRNATLEKPGTLGGTVTDQQSGNPLAGITVTFFRNLGNAGQPDWQEVAESVTTGAGTYQRSLDPGSYRLRFLDENSVYAAEFWNDKATLALADSITVPGGGAAPAANAGLASGPGSISGTVRASVGNAPLPDVVVEVWQNDGTPQAPVWDAVADTDTDAQGDFSVAVPAGQYRICFDDPGLEWARECYDDAASVETADDVAVATATETSGVDAVLSPTGSITGTVTSALGDELGNVAVQAFVNRGTLSAPQWVTVGTADTDSSGDYVLPVPSGSYAVLFEDVGSGLWAPEYYADAATREAATLVVVGVAGSQDGIDAVLARKQVQSVGPPTISGTPRVGRTLTSSVPSWVPAGVATAYQWKADGAAVPGATSPSFTLTPAQVGKRMTVTVTGTKADHLPAERTSAATGTVKVLPVVKVRASDRNRIVKLVVTVKAAGVATVTGRVKVLRKAALLKTVRLVGGKATVTLKRQPKGRQTYRLAYQGAGPVLPAATSVKVAV